MKSKTKNLFIGLLSFAFAIGMSAGVGVIASAEDTTEYNSGYGWTSNNASGTITQQTDGVRLSAVAATTGNIYDYTYDTAINVLDLNMQYTVLYDSTSDPEGAHSRMNFYILPEATSDISEGVHFQFIQFYTNPANVVAIDGVDSGWEQNARFDDENGMNVRLYLEGTNWFFTVNGSRYGVNATNAEKLNALIANSNGSAYLRTTLHHGGGDALGANVVVHSIDDVAFGTETILNESLFASSKNPATAECATSIADGKLAISGKFNSGVGNIGMYGFGDAFQLAAGELSGYSMTMDVSGVDLSQQKYVEVSFTNILKNADRMDAWDSFGDAANQPTILAGTFRIPLYTGRVLGIVKGTDGTNGTFNIYEGTTDVTTAPPHYYFNSYVPRSDGVLTFDLIKWNGEWNVLVNGALLGAYDPALSTLLTSLDQGNVGVAVKLASDSAANAYGGVNVPTDTLYVTSICGEKIGTNVTEEPETPADPYAGQYADEITGELEFIRDQWTNIAIETATYNYAITEEGLSVSGRNETQGFAAGQNYLRDLTIDHENEFTVTFKMPEQVYSYNSESHGYYCFQIGDEVRGNFNNMKSLYVRFYYQASDVMVASATSPITVQAYVWDDMAANAELAKSQALVQPKTTEGKENEITFRVVYDVESELYRLYANGVRISTVAFEEALTSHLDTVMLSQYFATTLDRSLNTQPGGAWSEEYPDDISMTIVSLCGNKIVNKEADVFSGITLTDATDVTKTSAKLHWSKGVYPAGDFDSASFTPNGYKIERAIAKMVDGVAQVEVVKTIYIDDIDTIEYVDTELEVDSTYYYTVYAVQKNEDGSYTDLIVSNRNKRVQTAAEVVETPDTPDDSSSSDAPATEDNSSSDDSSAGGIASLLAGCTGSLSALSAVALLVVAGAAIAKKKED